VSSALTHLYMVSDYAVTSRTQPMNEVAVAKKLEE
jgi:hypothetical protein